MGWRAQSEMLAAGHNRAMQQASHSKKYLYDSWAGERDPDFLIFAHKNWRHYLTSFCSVKEGVFQCQEVGS